jgi:DNA-binding beta-propeller fold protein YncE
MIADEPNEAIYVTDLGNDCIQKFDSEENFLMKWRSAGTGDGQFNRPAGMALDKNDEIIYVADTKNEYKNLLRTVISCQNGDLLQQEMEILTVLPE